MLTLDKGNIIIKTEEKILYFFPPRGGIKTLLFLVMVMKYFVLLHLQPHAEPTKEML